MAWDQVEVEQMTREAIASSKRAVRFMQATTSEDRVWNIVVNVADTSNGPKDFSYALTWGLGDSYESLRDEIQSWLVGLPR